MRTTLLGSLLDSVRAQPRARAPRTCGCSRRARSTSTARTAASRPPPRQRSTPLPDERDAPRRAADRPRCGRRRGATRSRRAADFFAAKGVLDDAAGRAARAVAASSAAREPFLHPGPRGARAGRRRADAGWLGELHPGVAARVGPRAGRRASSSTSASCSPHAVARAALRGPDVVPGDPPGPRVLGPGRRARRRELVEVVRRRRRRAAARRARCSTSTRARAQTSLALRLEFRAGDRTLTDEEIAPQREKIVAARGRASSEGELRG